MAIPMDSISSLAICAGQDAEIAGYNREDGNTYISLPLLLELSSVDTRHGIILKSSEDEREDGQKTGENKLILLTTEVEYEMEIPGEEIYPIPKSLDAMRFSSLFSGIKFNSESPVLILDLERLVQSFAEYEKELIA